MRAERTLLLLALVVALTAAPPARADADPASDILYTQNVYLPYGVKLPESLVKDITSATARTKDAGFPIKVAVIATPDDLGLLQSLWRKPKMYAPFLGRELLFLYKDTLIVVMPNGFGVFRNNQSVSREERLLKAVPIGSGPTGLTRSALTAVRRVAAASGHPIPTGGNSHTRDRILIGVGAALILAVVVVAGRDLRRRRGKLELGPEEKQDDDPREGGRGEGGERGAEA